MPLLDHFHPPTSRRYPWEGFHSLWASQIARTLNRRVLHKGLLAVPQIHVGGRVEVAMGVETDIATLESAGNPRESAVEDNGGGVAVATAAWAPPATALIMPTVFPDEFEIQVFRTSEGDTLVGAIELVSPGNKDRPETRRAFAAKCAAYLQQGIGLVIVDIVTTRQFNLHDELIDLLEQPDHYRYSPSNHLYVVAYRPSRKKSGDQVEIWPMPVVLGQKLPMAPLALRGLATIPIDLETTYTTTCEDARL